MHPYTPDMPRQLAKPRPKQGARLVALRKAAGLSQADLADRTGVSAKSIAYWETSATPPRSDVLPKLAQALGVRVEDILLVHLPPPRRPGPPGRLQLVFEQAVKLPRREQDLVAKFVQTLLDQRNAG
jgi:transcriptional regulator with XRE-family HTH domain